MGEYRFRAQDSAYGRTSLDFFGRSYRVLGCGTVWMVEDPVFSLLACLLLAVG